MQLIGMLDSPYVRRVAVSLQLLGLPFTHRAVSVFSTFEAFRAINPVVKAPTLVCDDGTVLMDSTLILSYAEALAQPSGRSLVPRGLPALQRSLRITGLAMAACEKSVQIVYEHGVRPPEKLHTPWLDRITGQLNAAYADLEAELARAPLAVDAQHIEQAGVATAIAWEFTQQMVPRSVPAVQFARVAAFSAEAEALPAFRAAPHSDQVVQG